MIFNAASLGVIVTNITWMVMKIQVFKSGRSLVLKLHTRVPYTLKKLERGLPEQALSKNHSLHTSSGKEESRY